MILLFFICYVSFMLLRHVLSHPSAPSAWFLSVFCLLICLYYASLLLLLKILVWFRISAHWGWLLGWFSYVFKHNKSAFCLTFSIVYLSFKFFFFFVDISYDRLGHPSSKYSSTLINFIHFVSPTSDRSQPMSEYLPLAKQQRLQFHSNGMVDHSFDLLWTIWYLGSLQCFYLCGFRYFLTLVNDFSRYVHGCISRTKILMLQLLFLIFY